MEKGSKPLIKCLFKWVGCRGFFSYFGPQPWAGVPKFSADESLEECFHQALWNLILPQAFENATPPLNIIADFRQIYAEGAAFTNIALYLQKKSNRPVYRWPRGNCWFNPLPYLKTKSDRDGFLQAIRWLIQVGGDMQFFIDKAIEIASLLIEYMQMDTINNPRKCTLRNLVHFLRYPGEVEKNIGFSGSNFDKEDKKIGQVPLLFFNYASEGTKKVFDIAPMLFSSLKNSCPIIIDEFDSKLHPIITKKISGNF